MIKGPLLLVGCGRMGSAMLSGWLDCGLPPTDVVVVEPDAKAATQISRQLNIQTVASADDIDKDFFPSTVIIAVKPQKMNDMLHGYRRFSGGETVFLSIAAGKTLAYFEKILGNTTAIIRAMPNTPATVRRAVTVIIANDHVSTAQKQNCMALLNAIGTVFEVDDENLIDPVTALSGGGPAYVFLLVETMANAGIKAGLPEQLSRNLARLTVSGSGEMLRQSDTPPDILRKNVTSPGGTTAEALAVLMADNGWQSLMDEALEKASERSRQLSD